MSICTHTPIKPHNASADTAHILIPSPGRRWKMRDTIKNSLQPRSQSDPTRLRPISTDIGPRRPSIIHRAWHQQTAPVVEKTGEHPVGLGGHADVWKLKMTRDGRVVEVAAKVLRLVGSDTDRLRKRLEREVECWRILSHDHIALFYGVVYDAISHPHGLPAIISQWYGNGTADDYLRQHPSVNPMTTILEIAAGVEYLHMKRIVHGDLKGTNVMIDDDGHARLIDFGLSRFLDLEAGLTTSTTSSIRWCAPELLLSDDAKVTALSDVYAFASTALELLTGSVPYFGLPKRAVYRQVVSGITPRSMAGRLRYNISNPDMLWHVLDACWAQSLRPPITKIRQDLEVVHT